MTRLFQVKFQTGFLALGFFWLVLIPNSSHAKTFDLKDQGLVALSSSERIKLRQTVRALKLKGSALEAKKKELAETKIGKRADAFCRSQTCPPFNKRCDFHEQYTLKEVWAEGKAKAIAGHTQDETILKKNDLMIFPGDEDYRDPLDAQKIKNGARPFRTQRDGFNYLGNFLFTSIVCSNRDLKNHVAELNPHDLVKAMHKTVAQNSPCQNVDSVDKVNTIKGAEGVQGIKITSAKEGEKNNAGSDTHEPPQSQLEEEAPAALPSCKVISSVSISKKHLKDKFGLPGEPREKALIGLLEAGLNQKVGDFLMQPEDVLASQTLLFKSPSSPPKKNSTRPRVSGPELEMDLPKSLFPTLEESKSTFASFRAPKFLSEAKFGLGMLMRDNNNNNNGTKPETTSVMGGLKKFTENALTSGIERAVVKPKDLALRRIELAEPIRFTQLKENIYEAEIKISRILFQLGMEARWKDQKSPFLDVKKALLGYYSKETPITIRARVQVGGPDQALTFLPIDANKDIIFQLSNLTLMYGNTGIRRDGHPVRHPIIGSTVKGQAYLEHFSAEELEHLVSRNFGGANAEERMNAANNFTALANQINSREMTSLLDPKKLLDLLVGPQIKNGIAQGLTQLANVNAAQLNTYLDTRSTFALNLATLRILKEKLNPGVEPRPDTLDDELAQIENLLVPHPRDPQLLEASHLMAQAKTAQLQLDHQREALRTVVKDTRSKVVHGPLRERMKALKDLIFMRRKKATLEAQLVATQGLANITSKAAHYKLLAVLKGFEFQERRNPAIKQDIALYEHFVRLATTAIQARREAQHQNESSRNRNSQMAQASLFRKAESFERALFSRELRELTKPSSLFQRMDSKADPRDRLEFKVDLQDHDDHITLRISENPRPLEPNNNPSCQVQNDLHSGPLDPLLDACVGIHTDGINSILVEAKRSQLMDLCLAVVGTHIVSCADPRPNKTIIKLGFKGDPQIKWLNQSQLPKTPGSTLATLPDWIPYLDLEDLDLKVEGLNNPLAKSAVALVTKNLNGKFAFGIQNCEDQQPCMQGQFITTDVKPLKAGAGTELKMELKKQMGFLDALTTRMIRWSLNLANGPLQGAMKNVKLPVAGYHYGYHTVNGQLLMCVNQGAMGRPSQKP